MGPGHFQGPLQHRSFSRRPRRDGRSELVPRPFKVHCNNAVSLVAPGVGSIPLSRSFATSPFLLSRRRTRRAPLVPHYFQGPLQQRRFSCRAGARGGPRWSRAPIRVTLQQRSFSRRPGVGPVLLSGSFATSPFLSSRRRTRRAPLVPYYFQGPLQQRRFSRRAGARWY